MKEIPILLSAFKLKLYAVNIPLVSFHVVVTVLPHKPNKPFFLVVVARSEIMVSYT